MFWVIAIRAISLVGLVMPPPALAGWSLDTGSTVVVYGLVAMLLHQNL